MTPESVFVAAPAPGLHDGGVSVERIDCNTGLRADGVGFCRLVTAVSAFGWVSDKVGILCAHVGQHVHTQDSSAPFGL